MGCPFFTKELTDPQGKNITQGFPLKYLSKMDFLFNNNAPEPFKVHIHSLFLESDMMKKMRELSDIGQLFFITDDTKIKGNKFYDQGKYYEALEVYEQVLGCYVWLEFAEEGYSDRLFQDLASEIIFDKDVDMKQRQIIREMDREIETETSQAMISGTLVNSMLAYMSLFHFEEATKCADLLLGSFLKDPEIYFRKIQVTYFDKTSTLEQLEDALILLDRECVQSSKPQKQIIKYKELYNKLEEEIDLRVIQDKNDIKKLNAISNTQLKFKLIQFFRDNDNQAQLQKGINEYQYFAKILRQIEQVLTFDFTENNIEPKILEKLDKQEKEILSNPKLKDVLDEVKIEMADSIFFHSNDLNSEVYNLFQEINKVKFIQFYSQIQSFTQLRVYNYAWRLFQEKKERREKLKTQKEKLNGKANNSQNKKLTLLDSIIDPNRMNAVNLGVFLVFGIILFYFGWGLDWINERHITSWLRQIFKANSKL